jgi:hypothetical protein
LRSDKSDSYLKNIIRDTMFKKFKDGWEANKKGLDQRGSMTQIGG